MAQRFKNILKLLLQHHKIAINNRFLIAPDERRPCVNTHRISDLMSAHLRRTADSDFVNTIPQLPFHPHDAVNIFGIQ